MSLHTIYLFAFLDAFNFALIIPVLNPHVLALGGSFMLCGILQSVGAGMQLFASPIVGGLSDKYGSKLLLICTLVAMLIGDALSGINSLQVFFMGRILCGIARHTDALLKSIIVDICPDEATRAVAINKLITLPGMAFVIAPVLGGFVYQRYGKFAVLSSIICTVDAVLIAIAFMYFPNLKVERKPGTKSDWRKYLDLLSIKLAVEAAYNFLFMNSGLIFTTKYSFTRTQFGFSIAYMSVTMIMGGLVAPHIKKRFYKDDSVGLKRIWHALILMVASFVVLMFAQNAFLHLLIFIPAGLAKLMLEVAWMEALTARADKSEKGFIMGVAASMVSAAGLICPLISGVMGDYIGVDVLSWLPFLPSLIGTLLAKKIIVK